jgi:phosphatidylserine decarboxylase
MGIHKVRAPFRTGVWGSSDKQILHSWLQKQIDEVEPLANKLRAVDAREVAIEEFHPVIQKFKNFIENDPEVFMLFSQMFTQVPFDKDPTDQPQVKDYLVMLALLNLIMTKAPEFIVDKKGDPYGLIGFPINTILDWSMGTAAGYAAFLNEKVNAQFKLVLNEWGRFLVSGDSKYILTENENGWFGSYAKKAMPDFDKLFICDPSKPYHGFSSWDDFFTRRFRDGVRPVAEPANESIITNACESAPYAIAYNVNYQDTYWIKGQPYSLRHMMADDSHTLEFVGGTLYQAFLSALSYHRWHSPVNGTIVSAYTIDGTYYSESWTEGYDPSGPNCSQGYITELAARALIFIKADNPAIGLMCFMAVGMAEVSSCEITVYEGQHVNKGDQIGMFHFGGSTHCLIFRPGVNLEFDLHGQKPGLDSSNIPLNSRIATVRK